MPSSKTEVVGATETEKEAVLSVSFKKKNNLYWTSGSTGMPKTSTCTNLHCIPSNMRSDGARCLAERLDIQLQKKSQDDRIPSLMNILKKQILLLVWLPERDV